MKRLSTFTVSFSLLCISCLGQQSSRNWKDLNYAEDSMKYHRLDIYLPDIKKQTYPVVILVYGSAWFANNLKGAEMQTIGKALLEKGFAVVTPNHRSSKDAIFPAQINDIKAAIRFIRARGNEYQLDTSFIAITGFSSGGHLAALAGISVFVNQFKINATSCDLEGKLGKYTTFSSAVNAVVDWFGPTDFLKMDSCGSSMPHNASNSPESSLIGGPIQNNFDKCAFANPITYVDKNDPPFLILHGDSDPLVPSCESNLLFNALQNAKVSSQLIIVPNGKHGPGVFEEKYFKMMTDLFTKELMNK
jgi:acetyl esterase/lipase